MQERVPPLEPVTITERLSVILRARAETLLALAACSPEVVNQHAKRFESFLAYVAPSWEWPNWDGVSHTDWCLVWFTTGVSIVWLRWRHWRGTTGSSPDPAARPREGEGT